MFHQILGNLFERKNIQHFVICLSVVEPVILPLEDTVVEVGHSQPLVRLTAVADDNVVAQVAEQKLGLIQTRQFLTFGLMIQLFRELRLDRH